MHSSISDKVVKNLNKLRSKKQSTKFKEAFHNLSTNHKKKYIEHVKAKPQGSSAMSGILNALKKKDASRLFNQLLQENKEFAFNTLDCINPTNTLFKTLFSALDKNQYIEHVKAKLQGSSAMSGILNALKKKDASRLFNQLLQENKEFAFNTLDCINPTNTFFKTLFSALDKNQYIEHVKAKPQGSSAMYGILNALKKEDASRLFNQLLQENKEFAFNTLDCINPTHTLFKTLFSALDKNQYIEHVKAKPQGSSAMSGILNALKKEDAPIIFNQLLQENKEFAFNTLDCINPTNTLFKTLFSALDKNQYIEHVKAKPQGSRAMYGILNALKKEDAPIIFNQLLQENKEFAFNTLDCINPTHTFFKTLFSALDKNQYIEHVKAKHKGSKAMSGILNALKKEDAPIIFNQLLQENKKFAFNTLDCIDPTHTLFKTLFDQLNPKEKEEYRVHLKTKSTAKAKYTLRDFYSSNLEEICTVEPPAKRQCIIPFPGFAEFHNQFSNIVPEDSTISSSLTSNENISDSLEGEQLSPESYYNYLRNGVTSLQSSIVDDLPELNLSPITPAFEETVVEHTFDNRSEFSYENEPLVQNRDDLPVANFSPISPVSEETVVEYAFDTRPEFSSDKESQLCSQIVPPFEGFAEFHNQFRNIVPEDSTVNDSSVPEEHTSLEGELTFLDSQINGGEPLTSLQSSNVNPLPEFSFSLSSVTLDEMVKRYGFNHNDHALSDLEEVYVEQPTKFHTYYHN